jgi:lysophospholipase L1-like esterase
MKKLVLSSAILFILANHLISSIIPNPIISRGKTVYTSSGNASYLVDNKYNANTWQVKDNSWLAIKLNTGATKVFFNWNNPAYAWSNELAPSSCPNSISFPVNYNLLVSSNSTNGSDGDWTLVESVRGNIVSARGHLINFAGASWLKMAIINGGGTLDEIEVFDASWGSEDVWFFAGTSISANTYKGTPPSSNFADLVNSKHSSYNPVMIRGGMACISSSNLVSNLPKYLKMAKNAGFWAIEMGTNDAWGGTNYNVAVFKSNLQKVIDSCQAYGIKPIIARVLATNSTNAGWQVHPDFLAAVDDLTQTNHLVAGPDLYKWFLAHPEDLNTDGVHPNALGAAHIQQLWAEKMDSVFSGCTASTINPEIQINKTIFANIASASVYAGDTVILRAQAVNGATWSWNGPNSFSSSSNEVSFNNIQILQAGNYLVSCTVNTCPGYYVFKLAVEPPLGIIQDNHLQTVRIFPNPSKRGRFKVVLNSQTCNAKVYIYNQSGKQVYSSLLFENQTEITANLVDGLYLVKVISGKYVVSQKLKVD